MWKYGKMVGGGMKKQEQRPGIYEGRYGAGSK